MREYNLIHVWMCLDWFNKLFYFQLRSIKILQFDRKTTLNLRKSRKMYSPLLPSSSSTTRILKYFKLLLLKQTSKKLSNPFQNSWQIIQIMDAVRNMRKCPTRIDTSLASYIITPKIIDRFQSIVSLLATRVFNSDETRLPFFDRCFSAWHGSLQHVVTGFAKTHALHEEARPSCVGVFIPTNTHVRIHCIMNKVDVYVWKR